MKYAVEMQKILLGIQQEIHIELYAVVKPQEIQT